MMTLVVLGLDALDPELVDTVEHPSLTLTSHRPIETIVSSTGSPSTHELWPTIITGLTPDEHGLKLEDGVAWGHPILRFLSEYTGYLLPEQVRTEIGKWILNNTNQDAFRKQASYYDRNGIPTVFDGRSTKPIGIPNFVVNPDEEDREHTLRRTLGNLFERTNNTPGGHASADPDTFYERCLEMVMIRFARIRRALRSREFELVFGYTSGLDLIGHISFDIPRLQEKAYEEVDDFAAELKRDLRPDDELLIVSDHGLQDGVHTEQAMVSSTSERIIKGLRTVTDIKGAIDRELDENDHKPIRERHQQEFKSGEEVRDQLQDLGYM